MPKPGEKSYLPVDWKRWVAENVLMNADAGDLRRVLTENGFDSEIAQIEIDTAAAHPYVDAARSIARQLSKRDWLLHTLRRLRTTGNPCPFDRRSTVTRDEFLQHYYRQNRPLLLKDYVSHWKAVGLWNREYLRQKAGAITVELQGDRCSNPRYELDPHDHTRTMRFDELVDFCFRDEESNDLYMTARNGQKNGGILEALWDDIELLPEFLDEQTAQSGFFFWFGPRGTVTPLHHDLTNNLMVQLVGAKHIRLIAPDNLPFLYNNYHVYSPLDPVCPNLQEYPLFANAEVVDVFLEAGDVFFLPIGWWHHVVSLSTSVTITCTNFRWPNDFTAHYSTPGDI